MAARASAAGGERLARARAEEPLVLEALERGVDGAHGVLAPEAIGEVGANGEPVGVVAEAGDGEEGGEFEGPNGGSRHKYYYVEQMEGAQGPREYT